MHKIEEFDSNVIRQIQGTSFASEIRERDDKLIHKDIVKHMMKAHKKNHSKKNLFSLANTIIIVLSIYCMISLVNIEAYHSFLYYEDLQKDPDNIGMLYYLVLIDIVHFLRIINCLNGIFGSHLKSQRIITFYMIFTSFLFILRSVLTILTIISFQQIKELCNVFFTEEDGNVIALNYCLVMVAFLLLDSVFTMISIIQGSNYRQDDMATIQLKEKILKKYFLCYDNALESFS